ncbi:MAG: proline reductase-associated electron transfer protein PrdC [Cetobacterium sp.]
MAVFKFPLKMHIGESCQPVTKIGDRIERGQLIADSLKFGAKIHSSVTGKVLEIREDAIIIEADSVQTKDFKKIKECSSIAEYAKEAGLVGAGGAGFPSHIKLQTSIPGGYIIANCVECEPSLEHNVEFLKKTPELVLKGIKYAMEATKARKAYIGIKEKNGDAINSLNKAIKSLGYDNMEVKSVKDIYPMGEERALINSIFGTWIEPKDLPSSMNCVVMNGETLANLARAIEERKPVIDKDITIVGNFKNKEHKNIYFDVPVGTSIKDFAKEYKTKYPLGELVVGGPYTGVAETLETATVTKISGGFIFTIPLPTYEGPIGLLVCACGADEKRLRDIATKMKSDVKAVTFCKNVAENGKCKTPGVCPGQAQGVMFLKRKGAKRIIVSNCSDCSNTVMCCAPKLDIGVYHATDHIFRTIDYPLTRRMKLDEE